MSTTKKTPFCPYNNCVIPYLSVKDGWALLEFYEKAFGAKPTRVMGEKGKGPLPHAEMEINGTTFMLGDAECPQGEKGNPSNTCVGLTIYVEDCDKSYKATIAAGGVGVQEPKDQFYGDRSCQIKDPFGISWYLMTNQKEMTTEELNAAHKEYEKAESKRKRKAAGELES